MLMTNLSKKDHFMINRRVLFFTILLGSVSGCTSNKFAARDANAEYVSSQLKIIPRSQEKVQAQNQCAKSFSLLQKVQYVPQPV